MNERDLVRQTLTGDREAYRKLIHHYRNAVYGLVISFVGDFDQAEDLAQEAFIRGFYRLHTLTDEGRFGGWLRTIAANLCRTEIRRRKALPVVVPDLNLDGIEGKVRPPDEIQEQDETRQQVLAAMAVLPPREREAVTLYYLDGERAEVVGQFLGISAGAVRGRLYRARKTLRKEMMAMARKTLSQNKLGPEFSKRIELRRFSDLARLTDEELKTLAARSFLPGGGMDLIYALTGDDPETGALRERVLEVLPEEDQERLQANMDYFHKYLVPLGSYRNEVMEASRRLQREGAIRPAPKHRLPRGTVDVERFCDLVRLTDYEIQQVLREVDTKHVAVALAGKKDHTGPDPHEIDDVKKRLFENMSDRVGRLIRIQQAHRKASRQEVENWRGHIVAVVHSLQAAGVIRSGSSPITSPRVDVQSFSDFLKLTDYEIQATLRETDTKDLAVALKDRGKCIRQVEKRMMVNLSSRVCTMIRQEMDRAQPSRSEAEACQQKIVGTVRRLQILGSIRSPSRRATRRQYDRAVAEMAQVQIERDRHSGRWTPRNVKVLLPYLATVVRDAGSEGAQEAFEGIQDPVFELGLRLLSEDVPKEEMARQLQVRADRELRTITGRYQQVISGMIGVREGVEPRDIEDRL